MKHRIKKCLKNMLQIFLGIKEEIVDILDGIKCRNLEPCLILFCDGGISSQIYQYVWGQMLIDKGYPVKYDYTFYAVDGKDMDGKFDRSYKLDALCYTKRISVAPDYQARYYKKHYLNPLNQAPYPSVTMSIHHNWKAPMYLGNYYTCDPQEYVQVLHKYVRLCPAEEVLDQENYKIYQKIMSTNSVGVHVRRGDMVQSTDGWRTPQLEYFVNAINREDFSGMEFFFFSDEMDWVKQNLLPKLQGKKCHILDGNGSDKGYMDLFLLSCCKHQIASQGSFGMVAFVLNPNPEKSLILPAGARKGSEEKMVNENVIYYTIDGKLC